MWILYESQVSVTMIICSLCVNIKWSSSAFLWRIDWKLILIILTRFALGSLSGRFHRFRCLFGCCGNTYEAVLDCFELLIQIHFVGLTGCQECRVGKYWKYYTAIIATESLQLLPRYFIEIFYYNKQSTPSFYMCAITNCNSISLYWYESVFSIVIVGINLISTPYCSIVMCITWQYSVIYCTCDIIEMWIFYDTDIADPNIAR